MVYKNQKIVKMTISQIHGDIFKPKDGQINVIFM